MGTMIPPTVIVMDIAGEIHMTTIETATDSDAVRICVVEVEAQGTPTRVSSISACVCSCASPHSACSCPCATSSHDFSGRRKRRTSYSPGDRDRYEPRPRYDDGESSMLAGPKAQLTLVVLLKLSLQTVEDDPAPQPTLAFPTPTSPRCPSPFVSS